MIVVNLHSIEGVTIEGTTSVIGYEAVSYTWGSADASHTMLCNDVEVSIPQNLASALREIQRSTEEVYIWVDAVCANQTDNQERAEQVAEMLHIYQKAGSVIAWLGAADSNSVCAVNTINCLPLVREQLLNGRGKSKSHTFNVLHDWGGCIKP